jgi:hypothetical protein
MKTADLVALLTVILGTTVPTFARAPEPPLSASAVGGSLIVFPKFVKGTVAVDGVTRPRTEIEVRARCPSGASCSGEESVKIRFHWVCPGSSEIAPKYVCRETDFDVVLSATGKASFNPEDPQLVGDNPGSIAPCPRGYLIGWVINPNTSRPIKYDGLTGAALLRDITGAIQSYEAFAIQADPNLTNGAEIATDIDPRTGTMALVFDGRAGHYQPVDGAVPANLEYHKLTGPLASDQGFLVLLTLDVRVNRPNYSTVIDLDFRTDQGTRASTARDFICWTEIQNPNIDANFTLAGALTRNGVVLSGGAVKVPFRGISDIPGPVKLLGLVPTDEGGGRRTLDPAYVITRFVTGNPTTVFVP